MKRGILLALILGLGVVSVAQGQEGTPVDERVRASGRGSTAEPGSSVMTRLRSPENQPAVPRVVKLSGVLTDSANTPLSGEVQVTFTLYKHETDEDPLWTETQRLEPDKQGAYTALLGSTQTDGVPSELFRSDEARWLGVQVEGQPQQSRILFVSVPYALKAVEAEKLGGKSVSDFVLSESLGEQVRQVIQAQGHVAAQPTLAGTATGKQSSTNSTVSPQPSSSGPMFPPSTFSGTTSNQIVLVQQKGTGSGLVATTVSGTGGSGLVGLATSTSTSNNQNGVYGQNAGAGAGVAGIATNPSAGVGVYGQGANFAGVFGNSVVTSGFTRGVFGQTVSPDGAGVHGNNNAATGFATGVTGNSESTSGSGVFGNAAATSGFTNGVFGQNFSPDGTGVAGFVNASSGFNSGVFGHSASVNGTGVFGSSVQWVGVGGQATATSGGPAYGVWGDSSSTSGSGVAGFADATSGSTNGVYGQSASPTGVGVSGSATAAEGGAGVYGQSVGPHGVGVSGASLATTGNGPGVFGQTASTEFGAGVNGNATATTGNSFGVFGQIASPNGNAVFGHASAPIGGVGVVGFTEGPNAVAGQFVAHGGSGLILQGLSGNGFNQVFSLDANGNLNISGNLVVSGSKSAGVKLQSGREVALYAVESPENWFEDFGSGQLNNGVAWVPLDGSFAEATNAAVTYHVFLTANGDSNGLYVSRKTPAGFEVREHGGSGANVAFDYRIAVRRRGYETIRMAEVQRDVNTVELSRQHLAELANSGNLRKVGPAKVPRIAPALSIRPVPPRPTVPALPKPSVPQPPRPR
jgi:hypothetical protein